MLALFQDIKLIKGYNRNIILDLTKYDFEFIDDDTYHILNDINKYNSIDILLNENKHKIIELTKLIELNFINSFENENCIFPILSNKINNIFHYQAISIEVSNYTISYIFKYINDLTRLTQNIYLLLYKIDEDFIIQIQNLLSSRQNTIITFLCSKKEAKKFNKIKLDSTFLYRVLEFDFSDQTEYLTNNWPNIHLHPFLFFENSNFNSGFFEKLHINKIGDIGFNYLDKLSIQKISRIKNLYSEFISFKKNKIYLELINITADKITVCSDCEFRYMCTDAKIPVKTQFNNKIYYKSECNYNPYISKWKNENGYKTLEECGVINNGNSFFLDKNKISLINKELWEED
jgi:hypothetical protein